MENHLKEEHANEDVDDTFLAAKNDTIWIREVPDECDLVLLIVIERHISARILARAQIVRTQIVRVILIGLE